MDILVAADYMLTIALGIVALVSGWLPCIDPKFTELDRSQKTLGKALRSFTGWGVLMFVTIIALTGVLTRIHYLQGEAESKQLNELQEATKTIARTTAEMREITSLSHAKLTGASQLLEDQGTSLANANDMMSDHSRMLASQSEALNSALVDLQIQRKFLASTIEMIARDHQLQHVKFISSKLEALRGHDVQQGFLIGDAKLQDTDLGLENLYMQDQFSSDPKPVQASTFELMHQVHVELQQDVATLKGLISLDPERPNYVAIAEDAVSKLGAELRELKGSAIPSTTLRARINLCRRLLIQYRANVIAAIRETEMSDWRKLVPELKKQVDKVNQQWRSEQERELNQVRTQAAEICDSIELILKQNEDKLRSFDKEPLEQAIGATRELIKGTDTEAIRSGIKQIEAAAGAFSKKSAVSPISPPPKNGTGVNEQTARETN